MKKEERIKKIRRTRRVARTRKKLSSVFPRLSVFRSNRYIYAQVIDDRSGKTLVAASEKEVKDLSIKKIEKAKIVGQNLAHKAKKQKIKNVVFDKGAYRYHGRIKALAEGAREGGLVF